MKLEIKNFGPIANGKVDLRPLTVFVGPNNTGKSWLATLIYVMKRHIGEVPIFSRAYEILERRLLRGVFRGEGKSNDDIFLFPEDCQRWRDDLENHGQVRLTKTEVEVVRRILKSLGGALNDELLRCYGVSKLSDLILENCHENAGLSVRSGQINHRFDLKSKISKEFLDIEVDNLVLPYDREDRSSSRVLHRYVAEIDAMSKGTDQADRRRGLRYPMFRVMRAILRSLFPHKGYSNAYYLPADRGGVMHSHATVVRAIIRNASLAGLNRETPLPELSGVLGDFLEQLIRAAQLGSRRRYGRSSRNVLARSLEDGILRGAVEVMQGETDNPSFLYRPKGWSRSIPLMNVSSMVAELAPVVLYLRYLVRSNDLLIIEEPESHLHPSMQRQFTEAIAGFVKAGVQVLLTTHSEWVLEELANIVARGESERKMENGDVGLKPEDVGVWLFDFKEKNKPELGAFIKEVRWEPDEGGYMAGYDEVAMALHNEWASLMREPS